MLKTRQLKVLLFSIDTHRVISARPSSKLADVERVKTGRKLQRVGYKQREGQNAPSLEIRRLVPELRPQERTRPCV